MNEHIPITKLYKTQISLTEWFQNVNHKDTEALRVEDNEKRKRLEVLQKLINVPKERQTNFTTLDILENRPAFQQFLCEQGNDMCAMRLIPLEKGLPKLRMRGHTVRDVVRDWFPAQNVDPAKYTVEFMAHPEHHYWSTIFIVNQHGVFGEILQESHQYLTQGFYTEVKPVAFSFDFASGVWESTPHNKDAIKHMKHVIEFLKVEQEKQEVVKEKVKSTFAYDYLCGYFETVHSEFGTWFIDYNRLLGDLYKNFRVKKKLEGTAQGQLTGHAGCPGNVQGKVKIIDNPENASIAADEILVCDMTSPAYVQLMQKALAIVTNRGGMLCHAAIIARELNKPCVVGTSNATEQLKDGDVIEVDADSGVIRKITVR